jgi:WD40-like Beta Propeller Repeat
VFGQISLVSREGSEQFLYAHDPAVSGNGRYVAFDGSLGGVTGVWLRDQQTGGVRQVAGGDAELPSISETGQYVSFTTNEGGQLPADTNGTLDPSTPEQPNVYVRDMALAPGEAGAFQLASAANGPGETPLHYESALPKLFGSVATGRTALSANGQKVAFVTTAESDLAGEHTPALQVAVRSLQTHETQLVSTEPAKKEGEAPGPVQNELYEGKGYGAVFSNGQPQKFEAPASYFLAPAAYPVGASISADGSTVAWIGQDITAQVSSLPGETQTPIFAEPLWRRIQPQGPTKRVTGGPDPENPACIQSAQKSSAESLANPCWGPFPTNHGLGLWLFREGDPVPQLSANGDTVAFLATAPPLALGEDFGKTGSEFRAADLYVSDMGEPEGRPVPRTAALTPLTELSTGKEEDRTTNASIIDLAISPDGTQVAFTTERTRFPLPSLTLADETAPEAGLSELYDVDLGNDTLTRITAGFEGGASEHPHSPGRVGIDPYENEGDGALSPSFTHDGDTLAFSSTASNLVRGDANTPPLGSASGFDGSDVFSVPRVTFPSVPSEQYVSSPPPGPAITPSWQLSVTSRRQRNGTVTLYVELPAAGTIRAAAEGAVRVKVVHYARVAHSSARRRELRDAIAMRTVANASATSRGSAGGLVRLTLALAPSYQPLAGRPGGFSAKVRVVFSAPGHPMLRQSMPVTFLHTPSAATKHGARAR